MFGLIYNSLKYNGHYKWPRADILALSMDLFRKTVKSAYLRSPFYREFYASCGISYSDLAQLAPSDLPVIDKETVRLNFDRIATIPVRKKAGQKDGDDFRLLPGIGYLVHTSGSTGKPCSFLYSKSAITALESNFVRLSINGGKNRITFGDFPIKSLHVSSVGRGYASMLLAQNGLKRYHAKSVVVDASTPLEEWRSKIGGFSPDYLSGYPSCINIVAGMQQAGQFSIRPKKIIAGGEPMGKEEMRRLSELFGSDVINYYGCTESILIGAGASWHDGIYLFDDLNFLETDSQSRLIITPLANNAFPLIRYRLDDIVEGFTKDFVPPLPFTYIDRIAGRVEELLWFENEKGKKDFLHPLFLDDLDVKGIEKYQFEQTGKSDFIMRCIALADNKVELEKEIRGQMDRMLCRKAMMNVKYRVEFVDRIATDTVSGKIKMVIKKEDAR
jgi:phenylacetate-CoA ligase